MLRVSLNNGTSRTSVDATTTLKIKGHKRDDGLWVNTGIDEHAEFDRIEVLGHVGGRPNSNWHLIQTAISAVNEDTKEINRYETKQSRLELRVLPAKMQSARSLNEGPVFEEIRLG